ncbi:MAG TPA: hypothetical protein VLV48_02280, partial [Thermoanaerobaculia bacterium]|nr:hypothetical protein [Thermoanaerobaculia bacterium]
MRLLPVLALITLFAFSSTAQEPPRSRPRPLVQISSLDQLQNASQAVAAKLELDAFVSARLAAAVADLEDFRTAAAIAKARGRIEEA